MLDSPGAVIERAVRHGLLRLRPEETSPAPPGSKNKPTATSWTVFNANRRSATKRVPAVTRNRHRPHEVDFRKQHLRTTCCAAGPAGGGFTTVEDLDRFAQAPARGTTLLDPASKQEQLEGPAR
jgi:hypothetical protein